MRIDIESISLPHDSTRQRPRPQRDAFTTQRLTNSTARCCVCCARSSRRKASRSPRAGSVRRSRPCSALAQAAARGLRRSACWCARSSTMVPTARALHLAEKARGVLDRAAATSPSPMQFRSGRCRDHVPRRLARLSRGVVPRGGRTPDRRRGAALPARAASARCRLRQRARAGRRQARRHRRQLAVTARAAAPSAAAGGRRRLHGAARPSAGRRAAHGRAIPRGGPRRAAALFERAARRRRDASRRARRAARRARRRALLRRWRRTSSPRPISSSRPRAISPSSFATTLPIAILEAPVGFPAMRFYQLWHERAHHVASHRWLRGLIADVARQHFVAADAA